MATHGDPAAALRGNADSGRRGACVHVKAQGPVTPRKRPSLREGTAGCWAGESRVGALGVRFPPIVYHGPVLTGRLHLPGSRARALGTSHRPPSHGGQRRVLQERREHCPREQGVLPGGTNCFTSSLVWKPPKPLLSASSHCRLQGPPSGLEDDRGHRG